MSLDISLYKTNYLICECGRKHELETECVYSTNITHNLGEMADKAGIYYALWRPEEIGCKYAKDIIEILESGYDDLILKPEYYKQFNSENDWGTYDQFLPFVLKFLDACKQYPDAVIEVDR